MIAKPCGCTTATCSCCIGTEPLAPLTVWNRPGLPAIRDRVGTHGAFLATMKDRLATLTLDAIGPDGQTVQTYRPLQGLTARDTSDFSIALLDSCATVGDVLTFYQERIGNEGYLRTATERGSVVELSRLVGYVPKPGVSASVFLSYTLDPSQSGISTIPAGSAAQSTPKPGEQPQTFETSEDLDARADWNNLPVRLTRPQRVTFANSLAIDTLYLAGNVTLRTGDLLLMSFGAGGAPATVRTVASATAETDKNRTLAALQPIPPEVQAATMVLLQFAAAAATELYQHPDGAGSRMLARARTLSQETYLGLAALWQTWPTALLRAADGPPSPAVEALYQAFVAAIAAIAGAPPPPVKTVTDPSIFVSGLLKPRVRQAADALRLPRSLVLEFAAGRDTTPQMLIGFAPELRDSFYEAWEHADVNPAEEALKSLVVFRTSASLFGATVQRMATFSDGVLDTPDQWKEWNIDFAEDPQTLYLDQVHDSIISGGLVLIQNDGVGDEDPRRMVRQVVGAQTSSRTAYGISGKSSVLTVDQPWWQPDTGSSADMSQLRATLVYGQSEALTLAEEPILDPVAGQEIELGGLFMELKSGRWIVLSGERSDIDGVSGVAVSELMMVSGLQHGFDPTLPGDKTHTTLVLATSTAFSYKRDTLSIFANVVKATHGATVVTAAGGAVRGETLGSGDGTALFQIFALRQPPLTFLSAATPSGVQTTLQVTVNDITWHEVPALAGQGPKARVYVTKIADDGTTTVTFGDGVTGARTPTGVNNINASYRKGIGRPGDVSAGQINLLLTRPLGVTAVVNPLAASGGADPEPRDAMRSNVPLAVGALDRLVSLQDYADFALTFAGVGKALAQRLSDGRRELVHLTIAGADDIPIDPTSDLFNNLLAALQLFGDPSLPVQLAVRELVVLVLSAKIELEPDYHWESVVAQVRTALLDTLGFRQRQLAMPALLSPIVATMQAVRGVAYVDVDAFGGVPERVAEADGTRRLLTLPEISATVQDIVQPSPNSLRHRFLMAGGVPPFVPVNVAGLENGTIRPTQLALLSSDLPETLVLNQIV